jgi:hypothetical protein
MTTGHPFVVLTRDAAQKIAQAERDHGDLVMRHAPSENMYIITTIEIAKGDRRQVDIPREYEALHYGDATFAGQWMRQPTPDINMKHLDMLHRVDVATTLTAFRQAVPGVRDPHRNTALLITHDPDLPLEWRDIGGYEYAGWLVNRSGVEPTHLEVEPHRVGLQQLEDSWPVADLQERSVLVVGLGSIGGIAADALAAYGVGRLELVDPDRFLWHNMVRHVLGKESVGRYKVDAMRHRLRQAWTGQDFSAHRINVVTDAHYIRPLIDTVDLVVCAADGIAPRRVVSHLARRANKPAVLACVLDNGAVGEVLRLRPSRRFGCLLCHREHLRSQGAIDPEADQELDYGTGHFHRPMTAVPPDLHIVGQVAAKAAVATLLESLNGDHTQRLPGEHAVLGLRPSGDLVAPFDTARCTDVTWQDIPPPRADCPTCSSP